MVFYFISINSTMNTKKSNKQGHTGEESNVTVM